MAGGGGENVDVFGSDAISPGTDDLAGSLYLDIGSSTSCDVSSYPWRMPRSLPKRRWVTDCRFHGPAWLLTAPRISSQRAVLYVLIPPS
jgi:hypothetical protein